jgi:hypothetical protein
MPQLANYQTLKVILPSTEGLPDEEQAWAEIKTDLLVGDLERLESLDESMGTMVKLLSLMIVDWNFTDQDGEKEPINQDSVRKLRPDDFNALIGKVFTDKLTQDDKKKLLSTSAPDTTETPKE